MVGDPRPRQRLRFRLSTLLYVVAIVACLIVVIVQQVQLNRLNRLAEERQLEINQLSIQKGRLLEIVRTAGPHRATESASIANRGP